jgi:putative phosphonate transport system ATP-binding protein
VTLTEPILAVSGLTKRYGSRVACAGVGFEVRPGEVLGIVGESGSGKSTVLQCVYLDQPADAGSIRLRLPGSGRSTADRAALRPLASDPGEELTAVAPVRRRWLRSFAMGMVYQDAAQGLDLGVSAGGNIAERLLAADWRHVGRIRERAVGLLDRVEVAPDRLGEAAATFSGGMRQRLQLAKALANAPPLVLLDEPTTGLDVNVQAAILDLIRELHGQLRVAMLVVSHDLGVIRLLAHRTLVMYAGRVVESGITEQVLEDPQHPYTQRLVSSSL